MNLEKAKALFYAQYLWQKVLYKEWVTKPSEKYFLNPGDLNYSSDKLLLRTVNQLTDDECKQIGRAVGMNHLTAIERNEECIFITNDNYFIGLYYTGVVVMQKGTGLTVTPFWNYIDVIYHLLKAFGILLPFTYLDETGKPVTLSPEEIIALGWAKTINRSE